MPEKTAEAIEIIDDYRWHRTGDKGHLDKDELRKILTEANINPLYHPAKVLTVEEIPKLGSGKNDYGATKKIALANPN